MTRYADPQRCPDCLQPIEYAAAACPSCGLSLQGTLAQELFRTLTVADDLLDQLRATQPVPAPVRATDLPAFPPSKSRRPERHGRRLSAASVPKILLGLGAACVLVAALVFLAVTWSVMGIAGRTATLVGFTVLAGAVAAWMTRRDLRTAAEALCLLALGLLTLDLFGARDAGWFGELSTSGFVVLLGAVLAVVAAAAAMAARATTATALAGAELVSALGVALLAAGIATNPHLAGSAALVLAVLVAAALAAVAHAVRLRLATAGAVSVTAVSWLVLTISSAYRASEHATAQALWLDLEAWPFVVAAALVAALAGIRLLPGAARAGALGVAQTMLAFLLVLPFTQGPATGEAATRTSAAVLVLLVAVGVLTWLLRAPWALSGALTLGLGSLWMALVAGELAVRAAHRLADAGEALWAGSAGDRFPADRLGELPAPWLLPVSVLWLLGAGALLVHSSQTLRLRVPPVTVVPGSALLVAAAAGCLSLYASPIAVVLVALVLAASGFVAWAQWRRSTPALCSGALLLAGALLVSLHAEWLSVAVLTAGVVLSAVVHLSGRDAGPRLFAGTALAVTTGGAVWAWGAVADLDGRWVALAAIGVLGALVLLDRGDGSGGMEVGAACAAAGLALLGVAAAPAGDQPTWTSVYLTAAGVVATASALLRADRREVGWLGGALLAAATWIRLWDTGIRVPEAYTLPSAVALCLVGLAHLRRNPGSSTMAALSPGLALGLVPSLLWVLRDPLEARSVLLGVACLVLLSVGLRARWTAPVLYAAAVGAVVVLRHAGPFVDSAVPRWVLIGAAGAVLIGMGVTWERRLGEARQLAAYVRELR